MFRTELEAIWLDIKGRKEPDCEEEEHGRSLSSHIDYVTLGKGPRSLNLSCVTCKMGRLIPALKGYIVRSARMGYYKMT